LNADLQIASGDMPQCLLKPWDPERFMKRPCAVLD